MPETKFSVTTILFCIFIFSFCIPDVTAGYSHARSALSPRHTGMEPPGGPRNLDSMPARGLSRTSDGGMGYQDAYGNTINDIEPEKKKAKKRLRSGAFGSQRYDKRCLPLPDPDKSDAKPVWSFN